MFVSCIGYTKGLSDWQVKQAIVSYDLQTYRNSQLIIINNRSSLDQCSSLEIPHNSRVCIVDRPGYSNGKALLEAIRICSGQVIASFPLDHIHHPQRLVRSLNVMAENNADIVAPSIKMHHSGKSIAPSKGIVAELSIYKSPAYTQDFDIDYGVWWQYPLLAHEHGLDIMNIPGDNLAMELPSEQCDGRKLLEQLIWGQPPP